MAAEFIWFVNKYFNTEYWSNRPPIKVELMTNAAVINRVSAPLLKMSDKKMETDTIQIIVNKLSSKLMKIDDITGIEMISIL